ncbi:MAG: hypothetical protein H0X64_14230, partial [Gemmatimonadaceae bacterium]|nr:hypothetical protein [Gemmatimonadaceae bacterium]
MPALRAEGLRRLREILAKQPPATSTDWVAAFERGPATSMADRQRQSLLSQV